MSNDINEDEIDAILNEELSIDDSDGFDSNDMIDSPLRTSPNQIKKAKYSLQ